MLAEVAGFGHTVTFPVVVKNGGMSWALESFLAQLVKMQFSVEEIAYSTYHITFKQGA